MQPSTTAAAGTLVWVGSSNILLAGEACTTRALPSRRQFWGVWGAPVKVVLLRTGYKVTYVIQVFFSPSCFKVYLGT